MAGQIGRHKYWVRSLPMILLRLNGQILLNRAFAVCSPNRWSLRNQADQEFPDAFQVRRTIDPYWRHQAVRASLAWFSEIAGFARRLRLILRFFRSRRQPDGWTVQRQWRKRC